MERNLAISSYIASHLAEVSYFKKTILKTHFEKIMNDLCNTIPHSTLIAKRLETIQTQIKK